MLREGICLYQGSGGELAGNIGYAFGEYKLPYHKVDQEDIKKAALKKCSVLIIPGGHTKKAVEALGKVGYKKIREFVAAGGAYIGICAGAYLASDVVKVPGSPPGLGIADIQNTRKKGTRMRKIHLKEHPITEGVKDKLIIYYQNGPQISAHKDTEVIATYQNGTGAMVGGSYGKGKVIIFSPHPGGMVSRGIKPTSDTVKLLENSIEFCRLREEKGGNN